MIDVAFVSLHPSEVGNFCNGKWLPFQDFKRHLVFLNSMLVETNGLKVQTLYFLLCHIWHILLFTNICTSALLQVSGEVKSSANGFSQDKQIVGLLGAECRVCGSPGFAVKLCLYCMLSLEGKQYNVITSELRKPLIIAQNAGAPEVLSEVL